MGKSYSIGPQTMILVSKFILKNDNLMTFTVFVVTILDNMWHSTSLILFACVTWVIFDSLQLFPFNYGSALSRDLVLPPVVWGIESLFC